MKPVSRFKGRGTAKRPRAGQAEASLPPIDPRRLGPVLVVGDLILDHYVWGDVERVSPEAPVQVLRWEREADAPGGAANVALNLASLGCSVRLAGVVGQDAEGRRLLQSLRARGVDASGVLTLADRPTTRKMRVIARGQHMLRIDREKVLPLGRDDEQRLAAAVRRFVRGASGVICSDYAKGVMSRAVLSAVFGALPGGEKKRPGRPRPLVLVDPKGRDFAQYRGADILTPNEKEVMEATREIDGRSFRGSGLEERARRLIRQIGLKALLVTRGAEGMDLFEIRQGKIRKTHIPVAQAHEVYDVTGAGDTVAAVMGMAVFGGTPLAEAARWANAAAGMVLGTVGTAAVELGALVRVVNGELSQSGVKILSREALKNRVAEAKGRGERVVFANGCFDLLHTGHLYLLQRARALGDLLVVGLNDDACVRRIKGAGRPLIGQEQRSEIIAALRFVDYVTIFSEPTPLRLIRAVRPDVLVKGGDYRLDQVVGRDVVEGYGGRVELIPLLSGFSTSSLVNAIRQGGAESR
ncbi:MAG: D-glycero-beta-D-manno-heptose 1-phosphate adenylyltransferase [Nitrospinota bacterium]